MLTLVISQKVDPKVYQDYKETFDIILVMQDQVDIDDFVKKTSSLNYDQKAVLLLKILQEKQKNSQENLINELKSEGVSYQSFYLPNAIWTRVSKKQLESLSQRKDIKNIYSNKAEKIDLGKQEISENGPSLSNSVDWNIKFINADKVWEKNVTGEGIIVANSDTGAKFDHPALFRTYVGNKGPSGVDHNYAWYDGLRERIDKPPNNCGYNLTVPCDDYGHGTHVLGTMVGRTPQNRTFSVAPNSRWMACRNMDHGLMNLRTFLACFQFYLAPHDVRGNNPDPTKRPHVVANSYGCSGSVCRFELAIQLVKALRAVGVATISSAGNSGRCSNTNNVPAMIEDGIAVGSTHFQTHRISPFSDKGPVTVDRSNRLKPDFTCPGDKIYSCIHCCNYYSTYSGTSMACPHIGGIIIWVFHKVMSYKFLQDLVIISKRKS